MRKSLPYRILAIFMAFLMFFSSTGFSMDIHYCQDELQTISLFGKAKSCFEMNDVIQPSMNVEVCLMDKDFTQVDRKKCCHNERLSIESLEFQELSKQKIPIEISVVKFLTTFIYTYINLFSIDTNHSNEYITYYPPILNPDIQVLFQSFLI